MPNIHPAISSFPIAFLALVVVLEAWQLTSKRELNLTIAIILVAAAVSLGATFLSGYQAIRLAGQLNQELEDMAGSHHTMGRLALISGLTTVMFIWLKLKAKFNRSVFATLYYLSLTVAVVTCYLASARGGSLVFDYGVGVGERAVSSPSSD